jgi:hypothetical protein
MLSQRNISYLALAIRLALPMATQTSDKEFELVLTSEAGDCVPVIGKAMQNWG